MSVIVYHKHKNKLWTAEKKAARKNIVHNNEISNPKSSSPPNSLFKMHTKRPKSRTKWRTKTVWSAEKVKKGEKSEKSSWQKGWGCSIIWRLTARAGEDIARTEPWTSRKKLEKSFEKGIDKRGRKWYNNKVARKRGKTDHWKLNNKREVQSEQLETDLGKFLQMRILLNKSKRS